MGVRTPLTNLQKWKEHALLFIKRAHLVLDVLSLSLYRHDVQRRAVMRCNTLGVLLIFGE